MNLLVAFTATILAFCSEHFVAFILSWVSVILSLINVSRAASLSLFIHWRSIPTYVGNAEFAILLTVYLRYNTSAVLSAVLAFAVISFVSCCITAALLYLLPVPSARPLNGKYKRIGTVSFEIPVVTEQNGDSPKKVMMPVQCWYPMAPPVSLLQRIYQACFQGKALMWTSGSHQQAVESVLILSQIAHIYKMSSYVFLQLGLARTNSVYQQQPSPLPSPSKNSDDSSSTFPVAIYSHGMYGWRQVHHTCCEQLASHGFVVFAPDHAPDAMMSRPVDDLTTSKAFDYFLPKGVEGPEERIFYGHGFNRRANDVQTLLDFIAPSGNSGISGVSQMFPSFKNRLNEKSIHVWGHSFGGGTMSTVVARDSRVSSAVILDGWLYPMPDKERQRGSVRASVLNVSSQLWVFGKVRFLAMRCHFCLLMRVLFSISSPFGRTSSTIP